MAKDLSDETFEEEVVKASGIVMVDFWAEWCGPCQAMLPVFDDFEKDMAGKISVAKINVDSSPATAQGYRVMSIPTIIVFKDGKAVDQVVGAQTKEALVELANKHM